MSNCETHQSQITHICCSCECFKVLCGKCVVQHLTFHKGKNNWPELFTLEELRSFCTNKLSTALNIADQLISEVQVKKTQEKALQLKINEEFIYLLKKRLLVFVDDYFKGLEFYSKREVEILAGKLESKLEDFMKKREEIQNILGTIESTQVFTDLLKVFQCDYEKIKSDYSDFFEDILKEKYLISFKESNMESFKTHLFDLINEFLIDNVDKNNFFLKESNVIKSSNKLSNSLENSSIITKKNTNFENIHRNSQPITLTQKKEEINKSFTFQNSDVGSSQSSLKQSFKKKEKVLEENKENKLEAENHKQKVNEKQKEEITKEMQNQSKELEKKSREIQTKPNEIQKPQLKEIETKSQEIEKQKEEEKTEVLNNKSIQKDLFNQSKPEPKLPMDTSFEITLPDYFTNNKASKLLHFFEENSKNIYFFDLNRIEDPSISFECQTLKIDFLIPMKSRSLTTPEGLIYLIGGYTGKAPSNTFLYDSFNQILQPKAKMNCDREAFGVAYLSNQIYVCGGNDEYGNKLSNCERYDFLSNTWNKIAPLNQKASGLYLTSFAGKEIFKFGGESTQTLLSQVIEVYDLKLNKWNVIQAVSESNLVPVISRLGACLQINEQNLFIFGGYYAKNDAGTNQSFLLEVKDKKYVIKKLNEKLLPHCAGFWNNMPFVHKKQVICLQNVADPENKNVSLQDKRRLLVFDSKEWKKIKNAD